MMVYMQYPQSFQATRGSYFQRKECTRRIKTPTHARITCPTSYHILERRWMAPVENNHKAPVIFVLAAVLIVWLWLQ
jgi:hypothetical protein